MWDEKWEQKVVVVWVVDTYIINILCFITWTFLNKHTSTMCVVNNISYFRTTTGPSVPVVVCKPVKCEKLCDLSVLSFSNKPFTKSHQNRQVVRDRVHTKHTLVNNRWNVDKYQENGGSATFVKTGNFGVKVTEQLYLFCSSSRCVFSCIQYPNVCYVYFEMLIEKNGQIRSRIVYFFSKQTSSKRCVIIYIQEYLPNVYNRYANKSSFYNFKKGQFKVFIRFLQKKIKVRGGHWTQCSMSPLVCRVKL